MFAARARASLKPLLHRTQISSLTRNHEIAAIPKRILHNRFNNGVRLSGTTLFHSSHTSESDVGVNKIHIPSLFTSLEDDEFFSELGSIEEKGNPIINLLTKKPEPEEISQKTNGKKKKKNKKKKKKVEEASDSISKLRLFTEKPELSWVQKTNGKRKKEANASLPSRHVSLFSEIRNSLSSIQDDESEALKNVISLGSEAKNEETVLEELNDENETVDCSEWTDEIVLESEEEDCEDQIGMRITQSCEEEVCEDQIGMRITQSCEEEACEDQIGMRITQSCEEEACEDQIGMRITQSCEEEEDCEDQIGMRIARSCEDLDEQLTMRRILAKDMEILLHSVMYLEKNDSKGSRKGT